MCCNTYSKFLQYKNFATHSTCKGGFCAKSTTQPAGTASLSRAMFARLGQSLGKIFFNTVISCGVFASHMSINVNWQESVSCTERSDRKVST